MFTLTADEVDNARAAISHHGYSAMLPEPPEWGVIEANWATIRDIVQRIDLDTYEPFKPLRVFAPKNRANVRITDLLHPQDLLIYTALVLIAKNDIENARISIQSKRVFSYRSNPAQPQVLYDTRGFHDAYRRELYAKAKNKKVKYVALADIADFYPRIYQHRLENVIESVATNQRVRDVARVLVRKLIANLMGRNSYGIPVGPLASRVLGEAVLIDVDATLQSKSANFVRWVDDYSIFCKSEHEAQSILFTLGEWLFSNHGLTLQAAKTKILPVEVFVSNVLSRPEQRVTNRDEVVSMLKGVAAEYGDEENERNEIDEDQVQDLLAFLQGADLQSILESSLEDSTLVDYEAVGYVLTKLPLIPGVDADLKRSVLNLVIEKAELLYPVAEHIASYVLSFSDLTNAERRQISSKLLRPLRSKITPAPDYYAMWILHIFASDPAWNHIKELVALYSGSPSQVIKRYAALAIQSTGKRAEAVAIKDDYAAASPLLKLAILFASRNLGLDERKHWKLANSVSGGIEKLI